MGRRVWLFLFLLIPGQLLSQITNLQVSGTTPTQAVIAYTAPNADACQIQVSEKSELSDLVNDVDTSKGGDFANSNNDLERYPRLQHDHLRRFVVGTMPDLRGIIRNKDSNGHYWSRALHAGSLHYVRVSCGASTAGITFVTKPPLVGKTFGEPLPVELAGVSAQPLPRGAEWSDPNYSFNDSTTGVLVKSGPHLPGQSGGASGAEYYGKEFEVANCPAWTNGGALTREGSGSARYSGSNHDPCILTVGGSGITKPAATTSWAYQITSLVLHLKGSSSGTGDDSVLDVCVTLDAVGCVPGAVVRTITLTDRTGNRCAPSDTYCKENPSTPGGVPVAFDTWSEPPLNVDLVFANPHFGVILKKRGTSTGQITLRHGTCSKIASQDEGACLDVNHARQPREFDAGFQMPCSLGTVNDSVGNPGHLCKLPYNNGWAGLYWIKKDDPLGTKRFLGEVEFSYGTFPWQKGTASAGTASFNGVFHPTDATKLYALLEDAAKPAHIHLCQCQLPPSGDRFYDVDRSSEPSAQACPSPRWTDLTPKATLDQMLYSFDQTYNINNYNSWGLVTTQSHYLVFTILSGYQDSLAWFAVYDLNTDELVAGFPTFMRQYPTTYSKQGGYDKSGVTGGGMGMRWCVFHTMHANVTLPWSSYTMKSSHSGGHSPGEEVFGTTLDQSVTDTANNTVYIVTSGGPLASSWPGGILYDLTVGDIIQFEDNCPQVGGIRCEMAEVRAVYHGGDVWPGTPSPCPVNKECLKILRGLYRQPKLTHSAGATIWTRCGLEFPPGSANPMNVTISWWDFVHDPHGMDTTGQYLRERDDLITSHEGWGSTNGANSLTGATLSENGYRACASTPPAVNCPNVLLINDSPSFAGFVKSNSGNATQEHPSPPRQTDANIFSATERQWGNDYTYPDSDSELRPSGALVPVAGQLWSFASGKALDFKRLTWVGVVGERPLLDVSGPGSVIPSDASGAYDVCTAYEPGECRKGSTAGTVYVNAPGLTAKSTCPGGHIQPNDVTSLCFGNRSFLPGALLQIMLDRSSSNGDRFRPLTYGLANWKMGGNAAPTMPDGKWIIFTETLHNGNRQWMVQVPPWREDSNNNSDFRRVEISLKPLKSMRVSTAQIRFGYDPMSFYCMSRREACIAVGSYAPGTADPYFFETTDHYKRTECSSGCKITVPAIPGRVVFVQPEYFDFPGIKIATEPIMVDAN
jgi:hypothetical protein